MDSGVQGGGVIGDVRVTEDVPGAFAGLVRQARPASFAVSGGDTARACYERLAQFQDLDWPSMDVLVSDERWVDVTHPDSNEGMARSALLDRVGVTRVHSARNAGPTPEEAAQAYGETVARFRRIDLIHLGMGADGHTASLFPGSPALAETDRLVVAAEPGQPPPHRRLTFTYPALARGTLVVFTVQGEGKREAFARLQAGEDLPSARVRAGRVVWLVTPEVVGVGS